MIPSDKPYWPLIPPELGPSPLNIKPGDVIYFNPQPPRELEFYIPMTERERYEMAVIYYKLWSRSLKDSE